MDISSLLKNLNLPPEMMDKVQEIAGQHGMDINNLSEADQGNLMAKLQGLMGGGNPLDKIQDMTEGTPVGNILDTLGFGKEEAGGAAEEAPADSDQTQ